MLRKSLWYYIKNYRFNSLFVKNFILILVLVVLPISGINAGIYMYYGNIIKDEIAAANQGSIARIRETIDMIFNEAERLSIRVVTDPRIQEFMVLGRRQIPDFNSVERFKDILSSVSIPTGEYIHSVYAYSDINNYVVSSIEGRKDINTITDNTWYEIYSKNRNSYNIVAAPRKTENESGQSLSVLSFMINSPMDINTKNGAVIVNINLNLVKQLIADVSNRIEEKIYVTDSNGVVCYSNNLDLIGLKLNEVEQLEGMAEKNRDELVVKDIDGVLKVITQTASKNRKWHYTSIIPLMQYEQKINNLKKITMVLEILCSLIALIVAFIISMRAFTPIKDIMQIIENPEGYPQSYETINRKNGMNELKYIASSILDKLDKSRTMEAELATRMKLLKQAQTLALQSQINPHFLYNTLQTINWLVIGLTKGENEASRVVDSLSRLLRATLDSESYMIPIEQEINYAKEYIKIQKTRYKNKFEIEWDVDQQILNFMITQIALQPLLENSIYHGIKPMKETGFIRVIGYLTEDVIVFEVVDNGLGMNQSDIESLNNELQRNYSYSSRNIGIRNVNQRIKLIFGNEYGVSISGNENKGLKVKIMLPKVEKVHPAAIDHNAG